MAKMEAPEVKEQFALQTTSPKAIANAQYIQLLMNAFSQCVNVVAMPEVQPAEICKRMEYLSMLLVHLIPNKKETLRMMIERDIRLDRLKERARTLDMSAEEYNDALIRINIGLVGDVMEIIDDVLGLVEKQHVLPMIHEDRLQENLKILKEREVERAKKAATEKITLETKTKTDLINEGI